MRKAVVKLALVALVLAGPVISATIRAEADERKKRGEYLAAIMDCGGCHTPGYLMGKPDFDRYLAGSDVGFEIPGRGIFYPPNLTPDRETGLGAWSAAEIMAAVRNGVRPDGRALAPVMPYHTYAHLTDADAEALVAYLKSLKPIRNKAPAMAGPAEKPKAPFLRVIMPE
jgi:mono/diheme cytochrome c family protein